MLLKGFAQPVKSKGVDTRIAESQNTGESGDYEIDGCGITIGRVAE